ncbi:MAG: LptE family protein [Nitrospina sp.]|jgi:outer membrane lipopolysaccharide assembly protein LptE/RlpB|nr:LptE family protein [Nitrospina sp.]MBT6716516.1 LptE family protein [Nitrospina sp.]
MTHTLKKPGLLFFLLCFLFSGCGYHLVGTGNTLPSHLKTIFIPVFENSSSQPEIHRELTSAILQSFITDGRLKVEKKNDADLVMAGNLSYYDTRAASFSSQDLASEIIIELQVEIEVTDQVKNKLFMKKTLKTQWDYKSTSEIANTESARLEALEEAYKDLGNRLVSLIIDQF